jgi:hypothetical protein
MDSFKDALKSFADGLAAKFALPIPFQPEDQLKSAVSAVLEAAARRLGKKITIVTEVRVDDLGRPDMGVAISSLPAGHVELKAPGKGATTSKLKGPDKDQWERFKDLPNILYTDANEWALYRTGEQVGKTIRLSSNITVGGVEFASDLADKLLLLLTDFLSWYPQSPSTPGVLARKLAPLCRYLRAEVLEAMKDPESNLSLLSSDWREYLFPDADDRQFADAYAQTLTYALLLAHLSGAKDLSIPTAAKTIKAGHSLLSDALRILGDDNAREAIDVSVSLLQRVIGAVDVNKFSAGIGAVEVDKFGAPAAADPWLFFYEDFLAEYDPKMRKDRGVYYTPVPVVLAQVRLVGQILEDKFDAAASFVDEKVVTLDPAAGTGTYVLIALDHALDRLAATKGVGMRAAGATTAARNVHAFELLVGPYAVAHLRVTQRILIEGGSLAKDGVHVYLTDTLESPNASPPGHLPLALKPLGEEHRRAQRVKAETPVLVCIGNPPYDRQQIEDGEGAQRKGGWVRFGDSGKDGDGILTNFITPLQASGDSVHAKNLYNDYVYFWRWALWKVFENKGETEAEDRPGIVSFISASSYLRGPGFKGMRQVMRSLLDELWIIDLEGDNLGARKTENVFAIQNPVAIAIGVRYGMPNPDVPATVRYTRIEGTREEKLTRLESVQSFGSLKWRECASEWTSVFLPSATSGYENLPLLTDLFPWQTNGVKVGRSWPISTVERETLKKRWEALFAPSRLEERKQLFKDSPTGRSFDRSAPPLPPKIETDPALAKLPPQSALPKVVRYGFRSFDRRWLLADSRVIDRPNPSLWRAHSDEQIYLVSLLTEVVGEGPAAVVTPFVPDLHHFMGSFGGAHIVPLWRDMKAQVPNVNMGALAQISKQLSFDVSPMDLFAYCFAILASPNYVRTYWNELRTPGPRIPITRLQTLFERVVVLGRDLIELETFGQRTRKPGAKKGQVRQGRALCATGTPSKPDLYPTEYSYYPEQEELHVGSVGVFKRVRPAIMNFSVSGLQVVHAWLSGRMAKPGGKTSSELDAILPTEWSFDEELLDLLWVVDHVVDALPELNEVLAEVLDGPVIDSSTLPIPSADERKPDGEAVKSTLF